MRGDEQGMGWLLEWVACGRLGRCAAGVLQGNQCTRQQAPHSDNMCVCHLGAASQKRRCHRPAMSLRGKTMVAHPLLLPQAGAVLSRPAAASRRGGPPRGPPGSLPAAAGCPRPAPAKGRGTLKDPPRAGQEAQTRCLRQIPPMAVQQDRTRSAWLRRPANTAEEQGTTQP